jgi:hypothetical protein
MNKSEAREVHKLECFHAVGVDAGVLARSLSALIRASLTKRSRAALLEYADVFGVRNHPEFII